MTTNQTNKEKLMELISQNQELISKMIELVREEKDNNIYLMVVKTDGILEPAVDLSGELVAGTLEEVKERGEYLLSFLPDYLELDVDYIKVDKELLLKLKDELSKLMVEIKEASENAAYELADYVADPDQFADRLNSMVKSDMRTSGIGLNEHGDICHSERTYWSEQEVPDDYYDDDDYDDDYDDDWDDDCCECEHCHCEKDQCNDPNADFVNVIMTILNKH